MSNRRAVAMGTGVGLFAGVIAWGLWRALRALLYAVAAPVPLAPDEAITLLVAAAALCLALWLLASVLVSLLGHLPGRAGATARGLGARWTPAIARRTAALLVGATLGGAFAPGTAVACGSGGAPVAQGVVAGSGAVPAAPSNVASPGFVATARSLGTPAPGFAASDGRGVSATEALTALPLPGWVPDRPSVRPQPSTRLLGVAPAADSSPRVVVQRGDTLWDIAQAHLGPDATEAEVAAEWPRWHEANREVIGGDPHFLLPGQRLRPPAPHSAVSAR